MKAHIGVDMHSGLVHTVVATPPPNVNDVTQAQALLYSMETLAFCDESYQGVEWQPELSILVFAGLSPSDRESAERRPTPRARMLPRCNFP